MFSLRYGLVLFGVPQRNAKRPTPRFAQGLINGFVWMLRFS